MRKELQEIEIIENYLMGKMNASEKADFEKQLETDVNLAKNMELQISLMAGLERMGLKNDLQIAKRNLFLRKVWTWFGVFVFLSALSFGVYKSYENSAVESGVEIKDERLKKKDDGHVTLGDSRSEQETKGDNLVELNENPTSLVTRSDNRNKSETNKNSLVTHSDSRSGQNKNNLVKLSDSRSRQDFASAEIPVKQFQTFKIDPTKPNTITGVEGTIIDFPANAFDTKSKGRVEIKLQEFYKLSDMVFANLTTQTASGELIETGGMVNIEAYQGDVKLNLAEGKSITVKFPFEEKKEGMHTFLGEKDDLGDVVWEEQMPQEEMTEYQTTEQISLPKNREADTSSQIIMLGYKPGEEAEFVFLKEKVSTYLQGKIRYPKTSDRLPKESAVELAIEIGLDGKVKETRIVRGMRFPPNFYKYVQKTAEELPPLVPKQGRGRYVLTKFKVKIELDPSNQSKFLDERALNDYYKDLKDKRANMKEASLADFENHKVEKLEQTESNIENINLNKSKGKKDLEYYILSSTSLGWINCDSYPLAVNGKSSFNVFEKDETINCSLVLHSVRGIVSPRYIKQGKYIFPKLPNEEEVSVLAFKMENNKNYVSYYKTVHNKQDHRFEFEPLTKEKLNQITAELDAIKN
ncbi:MAG: hypothetical protein ACJAV5_001509 [Vicingaceae bacterium]|jgi:hypothetical protein